MQTYLQSSVHVQNVRRSARGSARTGRPSAVQDCRVHCWRHRWNSFERSPDDASVPAVNRRRHSVRKYWRMNVPLLSPPRHSKPVVGVGRGYVTVSFRTPWCPGAGTARRSLAQQSESPGSRDMLTFALSQRPRIPPRACVSGVSRVILAHLIFLKRFPRNRSFFSTAQVRPGPLLENSWTVESIRAQGL